MLQKTLDLVERMTRLADEGDAVREDDGCGVLYGIIRDAAFKIRRVAEQERAAHVRKGWWPRDGETERRSMESDAVWSPGPLPPDKLNS
jgi:monoamine oxidase